MGKPNVNINVGGPDNNHPQTYKTVVLKSNIPFARQLGSEDTIYVIKWDYDLGGEEVSVPANCVLKFEGGSLSNGILIPNRTTIDAALVKIFSTNLTVDDDYEDSWNIVEAYPEWYGAVGDGITDDTDAFYACISNFKRMKITSAYSVDFVDKIITGKSIFGEQRIKSRVIQRNSNVPFAFVGPFTTIRDITFETPNNTEDTDVLHFCYSNGVFLRLLMMEVAVTIVGNEHTIGLHFNVQYDGDGGGLVRDTFISDCKIGIWYEFRENDIPAEKSKLQWITQHTVRDVFIYRPVEYGFRWDALSMANQGKVIDDKIVQTMWCYANYFENIHVEIVHPNSVGIKLGQGMGTVINPVVFNDLIPGNYGVLDDSVGYSMEFAAILPPLRTKMVTNIIGGNLEGQIKNLDYAYLNNISNLKATLRNQKQPDEGGYITLDSNSIQNAFDLSFYGNSAFDIWSTKNVDLAYGHDEYGDYIKMTRTNLNERFYLWGIVTINALRNAGIDNGLYTFQIVSESNLGGASSGFSTIINDYIYFVDGKAYSAITSYENRKAIVNSRYINITDDITSSFQFGFAGEPNSPIEWVKIYQIGFKHGIVGNYMLEFPNSTTPQTLYHWRPYKDEYVDVELVTTFVSVSSFLDKKSVPIGISLKGTIKAVPPGVDLFVGKPSYYTIKHVVYFNVYNVADGTMVGIGRIGVDGEVWIKYISTTTSSGDIINVYS